MYKIDLTNLVAKRIKILSNYPGPHGLSMFINYDNSLFFQAEADKESCYQITIDNGVVKKCVKVGDL